MNCLRLAATVFVTCLATITSPALAQRDFSKVEIKTQKLADGIFVLMGAGGNIGVSTGADGVFLIDDQFAPLSKKIMSAIGELSDQPVRYVVNTHWHGDHTGGNENFGKSGAVIVAHNNVRARMSTKQFMKAFNREVPASPAAALPVVTFSNDVTFHFNDKTIHVTHRPAAHTDGDSLVLFKEANVLHMGDTFFNGFFPFIDQSGGGSLTGVIAAVESALGMTNAESKIIPGHGPVASNADLQAYLKMLKEVESTLSALVKEGKSREDVIAAKPLARLGETWGKGFMKTDVFTGIVYDTLSAQ